MSASREKIQRQSADPQVLTKKQKDAMEEAKKSKQIRITTVVVVICVVLLAASVIFLTSSAARRVLPAAVVDGESVPVNVYTYYYTNYFGQMYQQMAATYGEYASYFMPTDLSSVKFTQYDDTQTWHEFLVDSTATAISSLHNYERLAKEEGYTLTPELQAEIEENIELLTAAAKENNMSVNAYLARSVGKGMTLADYRRELERSFLADGYRQYKLDSLSYTQEELAAYYGEHADDLDSYQFRLTYLRASDQENYTAEEPEKAMESLREQWAQAAPLLEGGADYYETLVSLLPESSRSGFGEDDSALSTVRGSSLSTDYADWLKDASRKENDVTFIEDESGAYVLQFVSRDNGDYLTRDFSYVLYPISITSDNYNSYEEYVMALGTNAEYAETTFAPYMQTWQDGGETLAAFEQAAEAYGNDTGSGKVTVDASRKGEYVGLSDWLFAEERKVGDVDLMYSPELGGYVMVCYTGENSSARELLTESTLRQADYQAWEEAVEAERAAKAETKFTMWSKLIGA